MNLAAATLQGLHAPRAIRRARRVLPGFGLSLGYTLAYLTLLVLIPLAALAIKPWKLGVSCVIALLTSPRVLAGLRVSFVTALLAALVNLPFGLATAWVLVRYRFPGRRVFDAMIDLPFALPTAVAGIALSAIYAPNGWLGAPLDALGIKAAYSQTGIFIALTFIGLPFVVRTVEPVLRDLGPDIEEAAATLGASRVQTLWRVVLPPLLPALLAGFSLAFGRAVGEYGSVIFIAGNIPGLTEIAPLLIIVQLEQYNYAGAAAIGLAMLVISLGVLVLLSAVQQRVAARGRA
jgi:sulfate transport system permease protein